MLVSGEFAGTLSRVEGLRVPVTELTLTPKHVGSSLHVIIPADVARREGIREGVPVRITIEKATPKALGLLKDAVRGEHFHRNTEGLYAGDRET